jgi:hypothetical protein
MGDYGGSSESVLKKIAVGVLMALLVGSSYPWWWGLLFPERHATVGIGACSSSSSPVNEFRDAPAPNGSWDWNCDGQIDHAWVACENLTQAQCDPHTNATGTPPGFCGEIRAPTGCKPIVGECGQSGWLYPCFYNKADGRCHAGGYETATLMKCR